MKQLKVLVVEDDEGVRTAFSALLEMVGVTCVTANDGLDGIHKFDNGGHFDLIISDNDMPKKTGLELLKHVRHTHKHVEFWLASGRMDKELSNLAISLGADKALTKLDVSKEILEKFPFTPKSLRDQNQKK